MVLACSALVVGGLKWQSKIQLPVPRRPWLRFTEDERREFVALLASQTEPRDRVRLACPTSNEEVCVLAEPFVGDFQRGHFFVENAGITRTILGKPTSGVVLLTYGHADIFDPQNPDMGKWVKQTPSLSKIEDAFGEIGINTIGLADESLPHDLILIYFGIEPDEATDKRRESLRKQRQEAERQIRESTETKSAESVPSPTVLPSPRELATPDVKTGDNPNRNSQREIAKSSHVRNAQALEAQGRYQEALRECNAELRVNPHNKDALKLRGRIERTIQILNRQ